MKRFLVTVLLGTLGSSITNASETPVLVSTPAFSVSTADMDHYLKHLARVSGVEPEDQSSARVSQAVIELYALETISREAEAAGVLVNQAEVDWLARYLVISERAKQYTLQSIEAGIAGIDFDASALDYYRAHPDEFLRGERVQVRTLLISTDTRSVSEALDITQNLISTEMSEHAFKKIIREHTDDEAAKVNNGLMTIEKGQTVPVFEAAAFGLRDEGEITEPVVSQFGVHTIQLKKRLPAEKRPFDDVRDGIVFKLEQQARQEIRDSIVLNARASEPEGYVIDEEAIHTYMNSLGHRPIHSIPE